MTETVATVSPLRLLLALLASRRVRSPLAICELMEVDELVTNAMNLMSSSRQLYALKPPSSAHGTRPTLPRSASAATQRRHGSSPGGTRACGRTSASQPPRPLDQPPSASLERFWRGGDSGGKLPSGRGSQSVPDLLGCKLPEEGSAQLEVALGLALACVLKERTVPKICAALAQATCAHVLPQWVKRVHVLLAQKNEHGVTVLAEVGSDSNIPTDGDASHPHAKRQQESLQLPIDRGLAAAAYTLTCSPAVLALCPTTSSDAFDVEVDGPAFGASAGNGLLAVPLDVNGRRLGAVLALGTGLPCGSDIRRRNLFASLCSLASQPLSQALEHTEAVRLLHSMLPGFDASVRRPDNVSTPKHQPDEVDSPRPPRCAHTVFAQVDPLRPLFVEPSARSATYQPTSNHSTSADAPMRPTRQLCLQQLSQPVGAKSRAASRPASASAARQPADVNVAEGEYAKAFIRAIGSIQEPHSGVSKVRQLLDALSHVCGGRVELLPRETTLVTGDVPIVERGTLYAVLRPPAPSDNGISQGEQQSLYRDGLHAAAAVLGALIGKVDEVSSRDEQARRIVGMNVIGQGRRSLQSLSAPMQPTPQ